jgi:hypothetical protein
MNHEVQIERDDGVLYPPPPKKKVRKKSIILKWQLNEKYRSLS